MNENELVPQPEVRYDLGIARAPKQVLAEAQEAAKSLQSVIAGRKNAVKFNGKHYLSFEDWQTCGRFYGVTAKIVSTEAVDMDGVKGFIARAEAINTQTGQVISAAESMCLNDEPNWQKKPLFQLRSMAQTRAAAKSLRNVLAWVVVLAGYEPNVAEEMTGDEEPAAKAPVAAPKPKDPNTVKFVPVLVTTKSGMKGDKQWTKYGVKSPDGDFYGTFDEEHGELARLASEKKTAVVVTWKASGNEGQFKDIVTIESA